MDIKICNQQYQLSKLSKSDFIRSQAIYNRKTTVGETLYVYTVVSRVKEDEQIDIEHLKKIYSLGSKIKDLSSLVDVIEEIRDSDDIDLIDMDGYLTATINNYLRYVFNSTMFIDSAFLDSRELIDVIKSKHENCEKDLLPLINSIKNTMLTNYSNMDYITDFLNDNKIDDKEFNSTIYIIPKLRKEALCYLFGFKKDVYTLINKLLESDSFIIRKDEESHSYLEEIYNSSELFKELSCITIYMSKTDDYNDPYVNRAKVCVWRRSDGCFHVLK